MSEFLRSHLFQKLKGRVVQASLDTRSLLDGSSRMTDDRR